MQIDKNGFFDLTYCTNVHSGESWREVFRDLETYVIPLKANLSLNKPFGIGLRLSHIAATQLLQGTELINFKRWLKDHDLYLVTINGFPYGEFHNKRVKEQVYAPDWSTTERRDYSLDLVKIICELMPSGGECGFSTSPLSYKPWLNPESTEYIFRQASIHLTQIVEMMAPIHQHLGKFIHIDIEPEPECLLETIEEVIQFYQNWLIPIGVPYLAARMKISKTLAEKYIRSHIQVCYDICHSSVEFENPANVFKAYKEAKIQIGKIQVSAAIKCHHTSKKELENLFQFNDSTYLHQVIERDEKGNFYHYSDLPKALAEVETVQADELRTHFHVPVFLEHYESLDSTQSDIVLALKLLQKNKATHHLEIETYTWDVLPGKLKMDLISSIKREYEWVLEQFPSRKDD